MSLRILDVAAVVLVATAVACTWVRWVPSASDRPRVVIQSVGGKTYLAPDRDQRVEVPGPLGTTLVEVGGGRVRIAVSPCPGQTCAHLGWVGPQGGWVACLPNRVFVRVERGAGEGAIRVRESAIPGGTDARIQ